MPLPANGRQTFQPPGTAPVFTQPPPHGPLTGAAASSALLKVNEGWKGGEGRGRGGRLSTRRQDSGDKPAAGIASHPNAPIFPGTKRRG